MYMYEWYSIAASDVSYARVTTSGYDTAGRVSTRDTLPMWSPLPLVVLVLLAILDGVRLTVGATLLKPTPQQLKYADQELGAL